MENKIRIIVGSVIATCVIVAIVVPCAVLLPADDSAPSPVDDRPTYTFDDLFGGEFGYSSLYPAWDKVVTDKYFTSNSDGDVVWRDYTKPDVDFKTLITKPTITDGEYDSFSVSADDQYIFFRTNRQQVWRHSYTANFAIYRTDPDGDPKGVRMDLIISGFPKDGMIQHMEWSPTEHKLALVYGWDIWVINDLEAATPTLTRVTMDGEKNKIYNGIPDWVYEEEMISSNNVLYWAPDSSSFAFLRTDDTNTNIIKFSMYNEAQYPETVEIAYPKAGTTNPTVGLWVYNLEDANITELEPPSWPVTTEKPGANFTDYYFSRFTWFDADTCMATWTDRPQKYSVGSRCQRDTSHMWSCSMADGVSTEYVENGWVGSFGPFNIVWKDVNTHFTIYARPDDDPEDGRWQIAKADWSNAKRTWLTKIPYDIVGLYFYDSVNDYLYFSTAAPLPRQRHVYRVKGDDEDNSNPECMTCDLMKTYENRCGWVTPSFSPDRTVAIINCRGYKEPMTVSYTIAADGAWSDKDTVLYNNQELVDKVASVKWPQKKYGTFKSSKYGKEYQYEMFVPADFDDSGNTKYPLLIEVYAGPEFQSVTDAWTRGWATTHMVSDKNIVVASVDGRGSAYEGYKFMQQAYKKLGQNEPVDQTDFAKYLASQNYIDENLVGLWGWSYGGYTTSHTLGYDGGETFKCGIAVAPLADWRWYDSMYAERYMGLPTENEDGYSNASIITAHDLTNFKNSEYTLIHGTADDNVHFQSAAEMEKALVEADVDFDTFFYADQAHSINKGNANIHIYRQLTARMSHCLERCSVPYPGGC